MQIKFRTRGNTKQRKAARAWNDDMITELGYFGSKGSGKSWFAAAMIFGDALIYPDTNYFFAREELNDLRKFTTPTIEMIFKDWGLTKKYYNYNGQDNFWKLYNGSKVFYLECKATPADPLFKRFGSMQFTRGCIEEAGQVAHAAKRNLCATVGRWNNDKYNLKRKTLIIGNPAQNFIYDFRKQALKGTLPPYKMFIEATEFDNKSIDEGYYEGLRQSLSIEEIERLINNNWDYSNDPRVLCKPDAIQDIFRNDHVRANENEMYLSSDLAMQGRARFITGLWSGLVCDIRDGFGIDQVKSTGKSIRDDLHRLMISHSVPRSHVVADSDGLGGFLGSFLEGIKAFHGGNSAVNKEEFSKLKDECAYKLAEYINKRKIKILCDDDQKERIIRELSVLKAVSLSSDKDKKRIIPKDEMIKLLGYSPDYLDMLLMRMFFELVRTGNVSSVIIVPRESEINHLLHLARMPK